MSDSIISLDVGGQIFRTHLATLTKFPGSLLGTMFDHIDSGLAPMAKTKEGNYFLDANPLYFGEILEYLRHGGIIAKDPGLLRGVKKLACYFGLTELLQELECENDSKWVILDLQRKKEVEMSIATLTKFEDSTLAKFFLGDEEAKKVLSPWIKKENENRYFIARPLEMSENVFTFLSSYTFFMKRAEKGYDIEIQKFQEELDFYGLKYLTQTSDDCAYLAFQHDSD